jgi:dTDP-glucose pyrophosphorylase
MTSTKGMKALVLAGGEGSRLNRITRTMNKCMQEFRGRPLIEYSLRNAVKAGVGEIVVVVGYRAESIINHFGNRYDGVPIRYVIQWERRGLVHAMECAAEELDGADFMLFLADEILLSTDHTGLADLLDEREAFALCGVVRVEDRSEISKTYAVISNDSDDRVYRLIEKPQKALNDLMGTGNCVFRNAILDYIERTPINHNRGEKELPDLIQCAIDDGHLVQLFHLPGRYLNINTLEDLEALEQAVDDEASVEAVR